ncbi:Aldolase-type TIM barrel [Metarhizium album ARSEF 1941]|uniref:Aldolase-type TIM barrel n=1 Tax=Metarhizium album (strain ARSEF 1941) TaxID=1081103 RepID=A0A0B2WW34_METAS|nr:Aldolase-type TIM barrel [Metarhizium album ARSEF 1941]KHN97120.1 Aldolase-type TIM barrel [Metarhizium album ARSEF 1941]
MDLELASPFTLPCGLTMPNRLAKAAMAEGWGDKDKLPQKGLVEAYGSWADGAWGLVMTGNVQVDEAYLGTPDDNAVNAGIPRDQLLASWREWAASCSRSGTPTIVQLNHPGRQSMPGAGSHGFLGKTMAPSVVPVRLGDGLVARLLSALVFGSPREMDAHDIRHVVARFVEGARLAHDAGFAGIQIHAAHGYLLAQFLSPRTNRRTDAYGGSPRNRARIVLDILEAVRGAVPRDFCVGIKLNSVDHQSRVELDECVEQLEAIAAAGVDFLEISGGTYENPEMMSGKVDPGPLVSERTAAREAFFIEFAHAIRDRFKGVPLMLTGGFRSRRGMEAAIRDGACDLVGIGRPAVLDPQLPKNTIFNKDVNDDEARLYAKRVAPSWLNSLLGIKSIAGSAEITRSIRHPVHSSAIANRHDMTQLRDIQDADDLGYRYYNVMGLSAADSLNNADTHALFANDVYAGCHGSVATSAAEAVAIGSR